MVGTKGWLVTRLGFLVGLASAMLCVVPVAHAAFPGQNGKIAFDTSRGQGFGSIYTVNPDGTAEAPLIDRAGTQEAEPAWSPDGNRLLFSRGGIWEAFSDGSGQRSITPGQDATWSPDGLRFAYSRGIGGSDLRIFVRNAYTDAEYELAPGTAPSWSPDGSKIAFERAHDVWTIDVDGSDSTNVTDSDDAEWTPDWSPDGSKLVYPLVTAVASNLAVANADGTNQTPLPVTGRYPVWSPDGTRIAFANADDGDLDIYTVKADGSDLQQVTSGPADDREPSWQPLTSSVPAGYPRPKAASLVHLPLVRAQTECTSPNRLHGPPLDSPSCFPAAPQSWLVTGEPVANGAPVNFVGSVRLKVIGGVPGGPDDADVGFTASLEDIRCNPNNSQLPCGGMNSFAGNDYLGELRAAIPLRITDKDNTITPNGSTVGTVMDHSLSVPFGCVDNANGSIGSTCSLTTTIEAMIPGAVKELKRAVWQLDTVVVHDGGPDGDVDTPQDEGRLAVPGVFVP